MWSLRCRGWIEKVTGPLCCLPQCQTHSPAVWCTVAEPVRQSKWNADILLHPCNDTLHWRWDGNWILQHQNNWIKSSARLLHVPDSPSTLLHTVIQIRIKNRWPHAPIETLRHKRTYPNTEEQMILLSFITWLKQEHAVITVVHVFTMFMSSSVLNLNFTVSRHASSSGRAICISISQTGSGTYMFFIMETSPHLLCNTSYVFGCDYLFRE